MGLFDFWKKNKDEMTEVTTATQQPVAFGVEAVFNLQDSESVILAGQAYGTIKVGDRLTFVKGSREHTVLIKGIEKSQISMQVLTNQKGSLRVALPDKEFAKTGLVLYNAVASVDFKEEAYLRALADGFIGFQEAILKPEDIQKASLADVAELVGLFIDYCRRNDKLFSVEEIDENLQKIKTLKDIVRDKLLVADRIYVLQSTRTGEAHLHSETFQREDGSFLCTDPLIQIVDEERYDYVMTKLTEAKRTDVTLRKVEKGEDGEGITNALGTEFYLNGALGVFIESKDTVVWAKELVPKPDFSGIPEIQVPVTNPNIVRWLLLMGQMGKPETKDEELVYGLYYGFLSREIPRATFLIPMQHDKHFLERLDGKEEFTFKQGSKFNLPTRKGKENREAISIFTDWKRLRMVFDEDWDAMLEPAGSMISIFDYIINGTEYHEAGCYVSQESFETMKKVSEKFDDYHVEDGE
ncbi:SseB family protein [Streptococcus suis]|uniref:SseB family protein n=1 Tax=Streptococcus suis TaxID=1307 RepID=UPI001EE6B128|nr:SseB family protein [Streptococcus suis]